MFGVISLIVRFLISKVKQNNVLDFYGGERYDLFEFNSMSLYMG